MRQRKKSPTSAEIEPTTTRFDRPILYRLNYEARREPVVDDLANQMTSPPTVRIRNKFIFLKDGSHLFSIQNI